MNRNTASDGHAIVKLVIFDCDGVLLDSRAANAAFYNVILARFDKGPLTEEQLTYVHSHTVHESLEYLFREDGLLQQAERFWQEMDYEPIVGLLRLQPGLIECLETLCTRYRTAIATSRTHTMHEVLRKFGLQRYFELVITSLDVRHPKPHPESLNRIISHFETSAREACYIGDSVVDLETARRANVPFVAYRNRALEADHHLSDFFELIPLLERLSRDSHLEADRQEDRTLE
jgi:HAD superfamily hydrolase (TIGR01549 family)